MFVVIRHWAVASGDEKVIEEFCRRDYKIYILG
jgi:hypothetical protein